MCSALSEMGCDVAASCLRCVTEVTIPGLIVVHDSCLPPRALRSAALRSEPHVVGVIAATASGAPQTEGSLLGLLGQRRGHVQALKHLRRLHIAAN